MKKIKILVLIVASLSLVSCSSYQKAKPVVSVEYSENGNYKTTTLKDGTTKIQNLEFVKQRKESEKNREIENL